MQYRELTLDDLDLFVQLRLRDLEMFSNKKIKDETIQSIREFYQKKLLNHDIHTFVGYENNQLIASATIYYYDIIPSNENPKGKVGQITNVWVDEKYRHQGIGREIVSRLISKYQHEVGMICLNSSSQALHMYEKMGFVHKDNYLVLKEWNDE